MLPPTYQASPRPLGAIPGASGEVDSQRFRRNSTPHNPNSSGAADDGSGLMALNVTNGRKFFGSTDLAVRSNLQTTDVTSRVFCGKKIALPTLPLPLTMSPVPHGKWFRS